MIKKGACMIMNDITKERIVFNIDGIILFLRIENKIADEMTDYFIYITNYSGMVLF
jgi:hypothetical protein